MNYRPNFETAGTHRDDFLIAGDHPIRTDGITLLAGQNIVRGTLLGQITASGKYTLSLPDAVDGSQVPAVIAAEDMDASAGDKMTLAYIAGDFNANQITFGSGHSIASTKDGLAHRSIYLHVPLAAYDPPASQPADR